MSSREIAELTGKEHKNVLSLIRNHLADFESFGPLAFETRKGKALRHGGFAKATEYAMLNEHQASLLIAFMRNSPKVVKFKVALIREFFRMAMSYSYDLQAKITIPMSNGRIQPL